MADDTARFETAQAFFCAIADWVGVKKMPDPMVPLPTPFRVKEKIHNEVVETVYNDVYTYEAFKQYYACVLSPGVWTLEKIFTDKVNANATFKEVETLLDDRDWYLSSLRIAVELLNKLHTISKNFKPEIAAGAQWGKILYWRAAPGGVMDTIDKLYRAANKSAKTFNARATPKTRKVEFNDTNKWSPADIYWATKASKTLFEATLTTVKKNKEYSFDKLNNLICKQIEAGQLLPLSLKKNAKGAIKIVPVNFVRANERTAVENLVAGDLKPGWTTGWTTYTGPTITGCKGSIGQARGGERELVLSPGTAGERRDVILYINDDKGATGQFIKFRHDPSGSGAFKVQIFEKQGQPSAGALGQTGLGIQMEEAGGHDGEGNNWARDYNTANQDFLNAVRSSGKYSRVTYPNGFGELVSMTDMAKCKALRKSDEKQRVKDYIEQVDEWLPKHGSKKKLTAKEAKKLLPKNEIAARYAVHLANLSGQLVANVSCCALVKWLDEGRKTGRTDTFIRNFYLFATSRTESSARFVIGK